MILLELNFPLRVADQLIHKILYSFSIHTSWTSPITKKQPTHFKASGGNLVLDTFAFFRTAAELKNWKLNIDLSNASEKFFKMDGKSPWTYSEI